MDTNYKRDCIIYIIFLIIIILILLGIPFYIAVYNPFSSTITGKNNKFLNYFEDIGLLRFMEFFIKLLITVLIISIIIISIFI
tara:strand:- start:34 stop:282 length:249 start_codon:yes stop_codon:yes gene_type:complete